MPDTWILFLTQTRINSLRKIDRPGPSRKKKTESHVVDPNIKHVHLGSAFCLSLHKARSKLFINRPPLETIEKEVKITEIDHRTASTSATKNEP